MSAHPSHYPDCALDALYGGTCTCDAIRQREAAPSPSSPEYGAWLADQFKPASIDPTAYRPITVAQSCPPQSVRGVDGSKDGA